MYQIVKKSFSLRVTVMNIESFLFKTKKTDILCHLVTIVQLNFNKVMNLFQYPVVNTSSTFADDYDLSTIFRNYTQRNGNYFPTGLTPYY